MRALVLFVVSTVGIDMAWLHIQELAGQNHMQSQHQLGKVNCLNSFVIVMNSLIVSPAF